MNEIPKVFGISNLLNEGCEILHGSLFSSRNWGRVCDLLMARLKDRGIDEFGFRLSMVCTVFEGFRAQGTGSQEPILLECGADAHHVAIGVSFVAADGFLLSIEHLRMHSRRIILREHPSDGRRELVALLAVSGDAVLPEDPPELERVTVGEHSSRSSAAVYVELGDLDYAKLLADTPLTDHEKPSAGEFFSFTGPPEPHEGELAESMRQMLSASEDGAFERIIESYSSGSEKRSGNWTDAMFSALLAEKTRLSRLLHQMADAAQQKRLQSDLIHAKARYEQVQLQLNESKQENIRLERQVDELKHAMSVIRQTTAARETNALTKSDAAHLQIKLDRAQRQVEEFKKMNKQLIDRLSLIEKKKSPDVLKTKNEMDGMKLQLDEAEHEIERLKGELTRMETRRKPRSAA